jgi:hypothetical protein
MLYENYSSIFYFRAFKFGYTAILKFDHVQKKKIFIAGSAGSLPA